MPSDQSYEAHRRGPGCRDKGGLGSAWGTEDDFIELEG